jgi:preflagellin peptidase FlaK
MMNEILDCIRVILCFSFFAYASWSDLKTREVSDKVWIVMAPLAIILTLFQFLSFNPEAIPFYAISFVSTAALSIAFFYVGAFGGADAKALICLALALPIYPNTLFESEVRILSPIFPLTVFSNAVLLAVFSVAYAISRNFFWRLRTGRRLFEGFENESIWRKILVFLTGYKVEIAELEKGYKYALEGIQTKEKGEIEKKLLVLPKDEERELIIEEIMNSKREGEQANEVWVTLGLPLLVFITIGFIISLIFGDLIWILLNLIFA